MELPVTLVDQSLAKAPGLIGAIRLDEGFSLRRRESGELGEAPGDRLPLAGEGVGAFGELGRPPREEPIERAAFPRALLTLPKSGFLAPVAIRRKKVPDHPPGLPGGHLPFEKPGEILPIAMTYRHDILPPIQRALQILAVEGGYVTTGRAKPAVSSSFRGDRRRSAGA